MKRKRLVIVSVFGAAGLLLAAAYARATDLNKIAKLAEECAAGKKRSCQALVKIATQWSEPKEIRLAAIGGLSDQAALREVALSVSETEICQSVVERLTDEKDLAAFARAANYADTIDVAAAVVLEKITHPVLIADLAKNAKNSKVQAAAVLKVTDSALLKEIAAGTTEPSLARVAAVANSHLSDQELFTVLVNAEQDTDVRAAAAGRLTNPALLAQIVENADRPQVRRAAIQNPRLDQGLRLKLAKTEKEWDARLAALVGLDDQGLLEIVNDTGYTDPPAVGDPNMFQSVAYDVNEEQPRPGSPAGRPVRIGANPLNIEDDAGGLVFVTMGKELDISCRGIKVRSLRELAALLIRDASALEKLAGGAADAAVRQAAEKRMRQLQK